MTALEIAAASGPAQRLRPGIVLAGLCLALLGVLTIVRVGHFLDMGASTALHPIVDFDAFHVAGQLALNGAFDAAYVAASMETALRDLGHGAKLMPWTYPPVFGLVVAPLATLPLGWAYAVFMTMTLTGFLIVLTRISGASFGLALAASLPAAIINILCGQNGFLLAALAGLAALGALTGTGGRGGVALGLMVIKPHLGLAMGLEALAARRWRQVMVAALTIAAALLITTILFGTGIWAAFAAGAAEARAFLAEGRYPLHRMVSLYAALRSLGAPAATAFAAHGVMALSLLAVMGFALRHNRPPRQMLGLAVLITPFLSPYLYDYDLTMVGIGLALLLPGLIDRLTAWRVAMIVALAAAIAVPGLVQAVGLGIDTATGAPPSLGGFIALAFLGATLPAVLRHSDAGADAPRPLATGHLAL